MADANTEFEWDLRDELFGYIARHCANDERSLQREIGPSGMGTPCVRKLGYRLAQVPPLNAARADAEDGEEDLELLISKTKWRAQVGKDIHRDMQEMLENLNARELSSPMHRDGVEPCKAPWCDQNGTKEHREHKARYLVEFDLPVGTLNSDRPIKGHVDFYDRWRKAVCDWKFPGPRSLKDKHALCSRDDDPNPGDEYRVQAHVYGRGAVAMGLDVERVAVVFIPMNGELREGFVWSEPYDPERAKEAFRRARDVAERLRIAATQDAEGGDGLQLDRALAVLYTAPDYCQRCDWFKAGAKHGTQAGCPGDASIFVREKGNNKELDDLMSGG